MQTEEPFEKIEYKGHNINIYQDDHDIDGGPRDWDNLGTMTCFHRNYALGDKHEWQDADEFKEYIETTDEIAVILPLFLFDHSGISISTGSGKFRAVDSVGWDWGQVGYIYVTKEQVKKEYSVKRLSKKTLKKAEKVLEAEVEVYDQALTGEVYGFMIEGDYCDDSCWGFYGDIEQTGGLLEDAKGCIDYAVKEAQKKHEKKVKAFITNHVPLTARTVTA